MAEQSGALGEPQEGSPAHETDGLRGDLSQEAFEPTRRCGQEVSIIAAGQNH